MLGRVGLITAGLVAVLALFFAFMTMPIDKFIDFVIVIVIVGLSAALPFIFVAIFADVATRRHEEHAN